MCHIDSSYGILCRVSRLSDDERGFSQVQAQFVYGTLMTFDSERAKYIKKADDFVVLNKSGDGNLD